MNKLQLEKLISIVQAKQKSITICIVTAILTGALGSSLTYSNMNGTLLQTRKSYESQISEKNNEIKRLLQVETDLTNYIKDYEEKIAMVDEMENRLNENENTINTLNTQISALQEKISSLEAQKENLMGQISTLESEKSALTFQINTLKSTSSSSSSGGSTTSSNSQTVFANCTELRKVYPGGVSKDHPAYQSKMDRDKDGWACE